MVKVANFMTAGNTTPAAALGPLGMLEASAPTLDASCAAAAS